ncbi:hypothetical protein RJ639_042697 [Escallonia herrerae]|uniref:AIPP2-like SPOC-like domain-containing protein n=1 Tax=Escallonia herrerae TaxID=1293975 RepID=A0AA89B4B3_9ASTE|nr:hypothetical protein RJ639_042697 [Escallonia herrerae]
MEKHLASTSPLQISPLQFAVGTSFSLATMKVTTICEQCGDKGFGNAFIYCVKCLEFAVHRYCLNSFCGNFDEFIPWVCESCEEVINNNRRQRLRKSSDKSGFTADTFWRGKFCIRNHDPRICDGFVAHVSSKACPQVFDEARLLENFIFVEMLPMSDVLPEAFKSLEQNNENISLYFFSADTRHERLFDGLVHEMISEKLALRAKLENSELLICTSAELPPSYMTFEDKHYLWGVFLSMKQLSKPDCAKVVSTGQDRNYAKSKDSFQPGRNDGNRWLNLRTYSRRTKP